MDKCRSDYNNGRNIQYDASEEGRLARSLNTSATTGRYNWPAEYLDYDENGIISDSPTKTVPC